MLFQLVYVSLYIHFNRGKRCWTKCIKYRQELSATFEELFYGDLFVYQMKIPERMCHYAKKCVWLIWWTRLKVYSIKERIA